MIEGLNRYLETIELRHPEPMGFEEIKPRHGTTFKDAENYVKREFDALRMENSQALAGKREAGEVRESIEKLTRDYLREVKEYSKYSDTVDENAFKASDLRKASPEEVREKRAEFNSLKERLYREWEEIHGRSWPTYTEDVVNENGSTIRRAGDRYDMHHIQPLCLGGRNEAGNLTPIRVDLHFDHCGVHRTDGPFDRLTKIVGGA